MTVTIAKQAVIQRRLPHPSKHISVCVVFSVMCSTASFTSTEYPSKENAKRTAVRYDLLLYSRGWVLLLLSASLISAITSLQMSDDTSWDNTHTHGQIHNTRQALKADQCVTRYPPAFDSFTHRTIPDEHREKSSMVLIFPRLCETQKENGCTC